MSDRRSDPRLAMDVRQRALDACYDALAQMEALARRPRWAPPDWSSPRRGQDKYPPQQPRDPKGKWIETGNAGAKATEEHKEAAAAKPAPTTRWQR